MCQSTPAASREARCVIWPSFERVPVEREVTLGRKSTTASPGALRYVVGIAFAHSLRVPVVNPGADLVKLTRGAPLAMGIALPCIGHRFLDQGVVIASSRKRVLSIPSMSMVRDGRRRLLSLNFQRHVIRG